MQQADLRDPVVSGTTSRNVLPEIQGIKDSLDLEVPRVGINPTFAEQL